MCRVDIDILSASGEKKNENYCWNLVDVNQNEYLKERNALFQASLDALLSLEEYPHHND